MIVVLKHNVPEEKRNQLINWLRNQNIDVHPSLGEYQTVLGLVGDTSRIDMSLLESLDIVDSVKRVSDPFKCCNRKFHPDDTVVSVGDAKFGGGHFAMIAGPCSVESEEQIVYVAKAVKAAGAQLLRGGAFKPRTSPYDFQGLHGEGIRLLEIAKQETGLPIVTELMNIKHLPLFDNVDVIQIGARNMQNYDLLKEMGSVKKPILLKRGLANTLKELLMSAEYIMASGNDNVILCERGIRTFDDYTRNTLDLARAVAPAGHRRSQPLHGHQPAGPADDARGRSLRRGRRDRRGAQRSYPRAVRRRTVAHLRAVCRGRREGPRSPRGGDEMTVGIVGLGLIGGSFAKAYHAAGWRVLGYDRDESVLSFTQLADAVDEPLTMDNIGTCELVLLCVRPLAAVEYLRQAAPHIGGKPVVIDCCGTKRVVCAAAFPLAKEYGFTYLGGHPMAGTQYSGFGHARANLYHNAPMVIVPPDFDNIELLSRVKELLSPAGFGSFSVTTADSHDEMIAFTSQMAHLVSNAYIKSPTAKAHKGFSAGSYKDMTRVAWLNAPMWSELFLENRDYMLRELDGLMDCLMQYRAAIAENDGEALTQLLEEGKKRKEEVDGR